MLLFYTSKLGFSRQFNSGNNRVNAFEKLPDTKQFPEYYKKVNYPIALDNIRVSPLFFPVGHSLLSEETD